MENKTYRAAVLGMGNMGRAHTPHLLAASDVEVVALCADPIDDAKNYAAEKGLNVKLYTDGLEMIEKEELDILYVCLPPFAHNGQVEAAAKKGVHIFIEKPIALNLERAQSMAKAVAEAGVKSQVGYMMRFGGAVQKLKDLIASGEAGKPTLYTARYECNSLHTPWWIDVEKSGGQAFEQVIHLYDMARHIMGEADTVNGFTANLCHQNTPGYTVEDTSISSIRFAEGGLGGISGSNCAVPNEWNGSFRVVCEKLVADFTGHNTATFIYTGGGENRVETVATDNDVTRLENEYFLDVVRGRKPEFGPISEGLAGLKMVAAVVESSAKDGAPIKV